MATMWKKTLAYLGLVEEPYDDDYADIPDEGMAGPRVRGGPSPYESPPPRPEPSNVRRIAPPRPGGDPGGPSGGQFSPGQYSQGQYGQGQYGSAGGYGSSPSLTTVRTPASGAKVHVTNPSTFNDVEEVGEHFRNGIPVIMNLAGASESVAKRMLDFASGLIYGLDGRIERVGDRVFLLTPQGVDVSTEERRRLSERGFFNQA